ncbi:IS6 family transposase, partial [Glaciimonas sp. CA11.2]
MPNNGINPEVAKVLKRLHYPLEIMLMCVRWYIAYPLSLRHLEQMMAERGIAVDHSTVHRWAMKLWLVFEKKFRKFKRPVGTSWRIDETYIKVKDTWKYLYRAVDKEGRTIDFLLTAKRDKSAAMRFFRKAMLDNGVPEKVTMDKSGANKSAIDTINFEHENAIIVHQIKYLNNIVEQDHRAIKRITKPMLGFKSFCSARVILAGIEIMHMISKGQFCMSGAENLSVSQQFYALVG